MCPQCHGAGRWIDFGAILSVEGRVEEITYDCYCHGKPLTCPACKGTGSTVITEAIVRAKKFIDEGLPVEAWQALDTVLSEELINWQPTEPWID